MQRGSAALHILLSSGIAILLGAAIAVLFWFAGRPLDFLGERIGTSLGVWLGACAGALLALAGAAGIVRGLRLLARERAATGRPDPHPASHRTSGPLLAQLVAGISGSTPARALAATLPWLLLAALFGATEPRNVFGAVVMALLGAALGRILFLKRPGRPVARALVTVGIPGLIAALILAAGWRPGEWPIPVAFLVGAEIGAWLAVLRERTTGPNIRVLAHEWRGIAVVRGNASGSAGGSTGSASPGPVEFDVRPLLTRLTRAELAQFVAKFPELRGERVGARRLYVWLAAAVMPIGLFALGFGMVDEALHGGDDKASQLLGMSAIFALMLLGGGILIWFTTWTQTRFTTARDHAALLGFAGANGFDYSPKPMITADGADTLTSTMLSRDALRRLTVANRESASADDRGDGYTRFGGVCIVRLATELPNIRLRQAGPRAPALSAYTAPARDQRLSLEGDFDRHFELFAPKGYESDALYLFTPDVMAWLIDDVGAGAHGRGGYDVELRDNLLILRSRLDQVTRNPADWQRLARAVSALGARITQWERWRDDRAHSDAGARLRLEQPGSKVAGSKVAGGKVAAGGRRLRFGIGAGAIFAALFGAVYLGLTVLANSV